MSDRTLCILLVLVAWLGGVLFGVTAADARPVTGATADAAYAAAGDFWAERGVDPCEGHVRRARPAADPEDNDHLLAGSNLAWAYDPGDPGESFAKYDDGSRYCEVTLDVTEHWAALGDELGATGQEFVCAVIVHERGHNAGLDHVEDWSSIMYFSIDSIPPICRARL